MARTIYDCSFEELSNNRGWVPDRIVVLQEDGAETVQVVDGFIQHVKGGPIDVQPRTNSDSVLSLTWKLTLESTQDSTVNVRYELAITKSNNNAKIRGFPLGFDNTWSSRGSCQVSKE